MLMKIDWFPSLIACMRKDGHGVSSLSNQPFLPHFLFILSSFGTFLCTGLNWYNDFGLIVVVYWPFLPQFCFSSATFACNIKQNPACFPEH